MGFNAEKAASSRVVLIAGNEDTLRRDASMKLQQHLDVRDDDIDVEVVIADQKTPLEWVSAAASVPFMGERRVVLVRNLLRVDPGQVWPGRHKAGEHPFTLELSRLPETAMLILVADEESGDEQKAQRLSTVSKRWSDVVKAAKGHVADLSVDRKSIAEQIRKAAKAEGKQMSAGTATLMSEMTAGSLTLALSELQKVALYVGSNDTIKDSDVKTVVVAEQEYNVYQLVDAIVAGDTGTAIKQLRTLIEGKDKVDNQAFSRIFPTISRQFRIIWQARLCLDAGCTARDPVPSVLQMLPKKPRINDERDWSQTRAMRAARRISLGQIQNVFEELVDADARIKGLRPSYSTIETVEQMVMKMSAICRSRGTGR